ncbi:MAG: hypothetical protein KCHDKBKB_00633 [Elusimicrobia bacterium]|nr:hypothetical protein [Elusimicrobiota bacterium]
MKYLLVVLVAALLLGGCTQIQLPETVYPSPTGYVVDTSNVLSEETELKVSNQLKEFDEKAQIAVVTVPSTGAESIEEYSINLAEAWKPGYEGKDNGVIFLIATTDRKLRIEVGRGLEEKLTDAEAGRILDNKVIPYLKNADWDGGVLSGVTAIIEEVK